MKNPLESIVGALVAGFVLTVVLAYAVRTFLA